MMGDRMHVAKMALETMRLPKAGRADNRLHQIDSLYRRSRGVGAGELQFQYYPCQGQEAIPATIATLLKPDDYVVTTYRGIHDIVAKGVAHVPCPHAFQSRTGRLHGCEDPPRSRRLGGPHAHRASHLVVPVL